MTSSNPRFIARSTIQAAAVPASDESSVPEILLESAALAQEIVESSEPPLASIQVVNPRGYQDLEVSVASYSAGRRIKIASLNPADSSGNRSEKAKVFIHESALSTLIGALVAIEADGDDA